MRQKKYEINEKELMENIIRKGFYCSVAFPFSPEPYLVAMNYGYENNIIYLHGATVGTRANILQENENCPISILIVTHAELDSSGENACNLSANHESVVIKGIANKISDREEKIVATHALLRQVKEEGRPINEKMLDKTLFIKVIIKEMTGSKRDQ